MWLMFIARVRCWGSSCEAWSFAYERFTFMSNNLEMRHKNRLPEKTMKSVPKISTMSRPSLFSKRSSTDDETDARINLPSTSTRRTICWAFKWITFHNRRALNGELDLLFNQQTGLDGLLSNCEKGSSSFHLPVIQFLSSVCNTMFHRNDKKGFRQSNHKL